MEIRKQDIKFWRCLDFFSYLSDTKKQIRIITDIGNTFEGFVDHGINFGSYGFPKTIGITNNITHIEYNINILNINKIILMDTAKNEKILIDLLLEEGW